jgi:hypothetical protein
VLTERFHEQGVVPIVYLNLMFGSVILVTMNAQSVGILLGHWIGGRYPDRVKALLGDVAARQEEVNTGASEQPATE